ncbi:MAG: GNAT family N-acetyltransferase [Puniceicoccaceae bacterium]
MAPGLELRKLQAEDESSFRRAARELEEGDASLEFAFQWTEESDFGEYLQLLEDWSLGKRLPEGWVPCHYYVGVVDGEVVGRLSLRTELNDFLARIGGHIGYAVVPRFRMKGYATEMLEQSLTICRSMGIERIFITCDVDNLPSRRVIEKCGGEFAGKTDYPELVKQKRTYWITA